MDEGPARMCSKDSGKRPGGTEWDNMGRESRFLANLGKLQLRGSANLGQNGTAVGKFCPVETSNCPPQARRSRIAVLDSCAAAESLQPEATALHRNGNRGLNAGGPISRHSRACGNPNPRLPSHQELKEEPPLPSPPPFRPILCAEKFDAIALHRKCASCQHLLALAN